MIQQVQEPIVETTNADGETTSNRAVKTETWSGVHGDRTLPESVLARIDAMSPKSEPTEDEVDPPDDPDAPEPDVEVVAENATSENAAGDPEPPNPEPATTAEAERLAAANAALVAELEAARSAKPEIPERVAKLATAAESYLDDDQAAIRSFIAHSIGVDDPNHKDVDAELEYLYTSLTAKSLGVPLDPNHSALRENARTRQMLARQKREREAEKSVDATKAAADADAKAAQQAAEFIGNRLQSSSSDYPLTMALAQDIDGTTPAALIWRTIQRESKAGRFDKETLADDAKLIAAAARIVESRYQSITTKLPKPPSTVTPNADKASAAIGATAKSATADKATQKSTRTLTNADASVAPATPAKKAATAEKPKFKNDAERREWALRRLPK